MRDPAIVQSPVLFPGRCAGCGTHKGPMVDTMVEYDQGLRLYVCVHTCLDRWAQLAGYLAPEAREQLEEAVDAAIGRVAELEQAADRQAADEVGFVEAVAARAAEAAFALAVAAPVVVPLETVKPSTPSSPSKAAAAATAKRAR